MRALRWGSATIALFAMASAEASIPPSKVCRNGQVDRQLLAEFLIDQYKFSWRAVAYQQDHALVELKGLPVAQQVIAQGIVCPQVDKQEPGGCAPDDQAAMTSAYTEMSLLLQNQEVGLHADGSVATAKDFFLKTGASIACEGSVSPQEPTQESPKEPTPVRSWRVRGGGDQVYVSQTDKDLYSSLDKFQLGLSNDKVQRKNTRKIVGAVGYAFDLNGGAKSDEDGKENDGLHDWQLVPYIGINDNSTDVAKKGTTYTANTRDAGVTLFYAWTPSQSPPFGPSTSYVLTLRPDYLWNEVNGSHIASLNASFVPSRARLLNARLSPDESPVSINSIFDLRLDDGHYTGFGTAKPGTLSNYLRFGSRFGFDIATRGKPDFPLDWLITETLLYGFHGTPRDIHYFKSTFSLGLDSKKDFTLDLSYSTGRREDTGEPERGWSLSFGAKY